MGFGECLQTDQSKEKISYSVSELCRVLNVSKSGYCDWKDYSPSKNAGRKTGCAMTGRRGESKGKEIPEAKTIRLTFADLEPTPSGRHPLAG